MGVSKRCRLVIGEVCGIFAGDGTLYKNGNSFVLEVRGNSKEEKYYRNSVRPKFEKVLSKNLKIIKRTYPGGYVVGIRACGQNPMKIFHEELGFPIGKKSNRVEIPKIILNNKRYWLSYIRGLFDTDGSVYIRKSGKGMKYRQPVVDIASNSEKHLEQIKAMLDYFGFRCWLERSNRKVRMAGWDSANRFFKLVNPQNNTKLDRFRKMLRWPNG